MDSHPPGLEIAIFSAGCFWDAEAAFRRIEGIVHTETGYTGGTSDDPDYEQVSSGFTGHAEAVRIAFDPTRISYDQLLDLFWEIHDPTGPFEMPGERSAIFFSTEEQHSRAEASLNRLRESGKCGGRAILTRILPVTRFFRGEEHHQQYYEKCGRGYGASQTPWD
jgi:methionine-S-sulfoxide reductase